MVNLAGLKALKLLLPKTEDLAYFGDMQFATVIQKPTMIRMVCDVYCSHNFLSLQLQIKQTLRLQRMIILYLKEI